LRIVRAVVLAVSLALAPAVAGATPLDATVFIRVTGQLRGEIQHAWKETVEIPDVEIANGSGFVISPGGHVLTNHHVVRGGERVIEKDGRPLTVAVEVTGIEVLFPSDGTRLHARIEAVDPQLDLAVLLVPAVDLPYVRLGDSDALFPGQPVQVIGFPLGRAVDVGRSAANDAVPQATMSRGSVAAVRTGDEGDARYIQTDAVVQPGSSGGPMVDEQGYAIGVIRMAIARRSGVAFAIPVNRVKDFLEQSGLDRVFPSRRGRLGPLESFPGKGIRLRVPEGFEDASRARLRIEWRPGDEVALLVERVATPLGLSDLEGALLESRDLPGLVAGRVASSRRDRLAGRAALLGTARGSGRDGAPLEMIHAVFDLGREKVIARYVGPPDLVAFNRSVFQGSLASLEADPLLLAEVAPNHRPELQPVSLHESGRIALSWSGWLGEESELTTCPTLPAPDGVLALSPTGDYTVSVRLASWRGPAVAPAEALAACSAPADGYLVRHERLGVTSLIRGTFLWSVGRLWAIEMEAPAEKEPIVREGFARWAAEVMRAAEAAP
jgi:S1-C subfamily serine protease